MFIRNVRSRNNCSQNGVSINAFCCNFSNIPLHLDEAQKIYSFWDDCGVKTPPFSYIWGHLRTPYLNGALANRVKHMYNYLKLNGLKHGGFYLFQEPLYVPMDLDICKAIIQTDFQHFVDRGGFVVEGDPLTAQLLNLKGRQWKAMRSKLTPTFSSGKMKIMFETMLECSHGLKKVMDELQSTQVDIKDVLGRFSTDVIGTCCFGIECNSLTEPENEFRLKGKFVFDRSRDFWFQIHLKLLTYFPKLMGFFNMKYFPNHLTEFFFGIVKNTVEYREKYGITCNDLMDLLIKIKNKDQLTTGEVNMNGDSSQDIQKFTIDDIVAESFLFFLAGFETASTAMTFCLFELASNKDIQHKLRKEINEVLKKFDGRITYEAIMNMPYLDKVLQESLRKHPPAPAFRRICTIPYRVPGTDIVLRTGANVVIPVYGFHHDPLYYPDPDKFDPERFSEENMKKRHPMAYLPFGEGPRMCIGMRFAMMEQKIAIITLVKNYEFEIGSNTIIPLKWSSQNFILSAIGEIWLKHKKIES
uniref:Cytochrome P450 6FP7 n=1 Tax=Propylea japonica TaxID=158624 RepID=X4R8A1_9CUCU|nr:cytochrome P450 6FP7 [Propylea japonica]